MNLTPLQRLKVFLLYHNATVLYNERKWLIESLDLRGKMAGELLLIELKSIDLAIDLARAYVTGCKLLLRDIVDITEEEKTELAKLSYREDSETIDIKGNDIVFRGGIHDDNPSWVEAIEVFDLPYPAADYLRSINVMLPYQGIDLFEAGIAKRINS